MAAMLTSASTAKLPSAVTSRAISGSHAGPRGRAGSPGWRKASSNRLSISCSLPSPISSASSAKSQNPAAMDASAASTGISRRFIDDAPIRS
jgi:hypothetical protein